jgi:hypothetical protein
MLYQQQDEEDIHQDLSSYKPILDISKEVLILTTQEHVACKPFKGSEKYHNQ